MYIDKYAQYHGASDHGVGVESQAEYPVTVVVQSVHQ